MRRAAREAEGATLLSKAHLLAGALLEELADDALRIDT